MFVEESESVFRSNPDLRTIHRNRKDMIVGKPVLDRKLFPFRLDVGQVQNLPGFLLLFTSRVVRQNAINCRLSWLCVARAACSYDGEWLVWYATGLQILSIAIRVFNPVVRSGRSRYHPCRCT